MSLFADLIRGGTHRDRAQLVAQNLIALKYMHGHMALAAERTGEQEKIAVMFSMFTRSSLIHFDYFMSTGDLSRRFAKEARDISRLLRMTHAQIVQDMTPRPDFDEVFRPALGWDRFHHMPYALTLSEVFEQFST